MLQAKDTNIVIGQGASTRRKWIPNKIMKVEMD